MFYYYAHTCSIWYMENYPNDYLDNTTHKNKYSLESKKVRQMTNKLEKEFFDTFGIEPRHKCTDGALEPCDEQCNECGYYELRYPQITDRILLELICVNPLCVEFIRPKDISELKNIIIKYFINNLKSYAELSEAEIFKHQVQALFEEER